MIKYELTLIGFELLFSKISEESNSECISELKGVVLQLIDDMELQNDYLLLSLVSKYKKLYDELELRLEEIKK